MDQETQQDLKKQYDSLPVELQKAINSVDLSLALQKIVKDNQLMIDQAGKLELETYLVLFGLERLDNYIENLTKNVNLTKDKATIVAKNVDELVFKNVREYLKEISNAYSTQDSTDKIGVSPIPEKALPSSIEVPRSNISMIPEVAPIIPLPVVSSLVQKKEKPFHINIPPVTNVIKSKLNDMVTVQKENIIIEEKTKIPQKPKFSGDPYKETLI